ncbi:DUF262 domain-containing protein [Candidatus Electrothrix aarhusensis]
MIDLLDSIRLRYPIGSLLVWDTDEGLSSSPTIGHILVPKAAAGVYSYVLDGHQRLSTLAGTLTAPVDGNSIPAEEDPKRWEIWYNAKNEQFEHLSCGSSPMSWHFPMHKLMDTIAFLGECGRILKEGGEEGNLYVSKVQELLRTFTEYKLPIVRIRNTALTQAVDIFARLNSKGQAMSPDQMVTALMYKEESGGKSDLNIAEVIDDLLEMLSDYGFGHINRTIILRALLACMEEDIYRTDWTRLTDKKRGELQYRLPKIVKPTMAAVNRAARFLNSIGVYNDRLLPYSTQIIVLTAFFLKCKQPVPQQTAFLKRWFWVSSYTGWFASASTTRVGHLVAEMRDTVSQEATPSGLENMRMEEPAQSFPKTFNMSSARARTWLLVLLGLNPMDNNGKLLPEPWKLVAAHGPNAVGYIAATVQNKDLGSSPANRILRITKDRSQGWNWLSALKKRARNEVLESHGIPSEAWGPLLLGDRDAFIKMRQDHLIQLELNHMQKQGVALPLDSTPQAAPIDTE